MQKVIPGSSRAAMAFMLQHWKSLALLSLAPAAIMLVLIYLEQEYALVNLCEMSRLGQGVMSVMPTGLSMVLFLSALNLIPTTWLFVRIIQYWARQNYSIGLGSPREIPNSLMTLGYGVLIAAFSMAFYVFVSVVLLTLSEITGSTPITGIDMNAPSFMIFGAIITTLVLWFFYRFAVALPGVALDERPNLFQDVWPLAKGESFAVPARIALSFIAITVLFWFYGSFTTSSVIDEFGERFRSQPTLTVTPEILSEWNLRVAPFAMFGSLFSIPFTWFVSLLLAEAYTRLRRRGPFTI